MLKNCLARAIARLSLCCLLFGPLSVSGAESFADSPYIIDVLGPRDGLPQSSVFSIVQSKVGYLWLGTLNGLVRFDGVRFTVFDEANTPELSTSHIVYLFEDSRTNLWVGTEAEGVMVIRQNGRVEPVDLGGSGGRGARLMSACEDAHGAIWLYVADGRLCRYRGPGQVEVLNAGTDGISGTRVVIAEGPNRLWVGMDQGMVALGQIGSDDLTAVPAQFVAANVQYLLSSRTGGYWRLANGRVEKWENDRLQMDLREYPEGVARVTAACEDREGHLFVGTQGGGVISYESPWSPTRISSEQGLSHTTVLSLCMDREGNLWVGTDGGGLNRVRRRQFRVMQGSEWLTIQSVAEDRQGGLWFANFGGLLSHWNGGKLTQYDNRNGLADLNMRSVFVDRSERVWVGTTFGGLFVKEGSRDSQFRAARGAENLNPFISAIYQDRKGVLWFGTQGGLARWDEEEWRIYTTADGLSGNAVRAIAEDVEGNLWVGTEQNGLSLLRDGSFTTYRKSAGGLPSDNISALWSDAGGVLWVGTGAGLARLENSQWTRYTTEQGLAGNGIGYILEDRDGALWLGSYAGVMRISKQSLNDVARGVATAVSCRVYDEADGLPTRECSQGSQPAACQTPDGRLWFTTIKGLVSVHPSALQTNLYEPPVIIESVRVEGTEQNTNDLAAAGIQSVVVPPGKERIEIHYTSLNLGAATRSQFRYRLEGHETGWTDAGGRRVAPYSNLRPGDYRFHVIACNEDGVWNETGAALAVTVLPPFWRTWWFTTAAVLCLLGLIVGSVHYISTQKLQRQLAALQQQEALEQERARIARDLHDQLGANLTQVALLGEMAEADKAVPDEVEDHARQISQTARETTKALDEIVWAVNPANDTLDGLASYLCKYAQEYLETAGLRHRIEMPAELPDAVLAPEHRHNIFLAAKEALNNVVKHAQATAVWVRLRLEPGGFTIEIEDNGRGPGGAEAASDRNGLKNMRKRMDDIGGRFAMEPAPERGTRVRFTAPIKSHAQGQLS